MTHVPSLVGTGLEGTSTAHSADATPLTDAQIDYAIGTRVMRWGVCTVHGQPAWNVPVNGNHGYVFYQSEWRPSRNIADAWRVLEQFVKRGDDVWVMTAPVGWRCLIASDNNIDFEGNADTAPRAICVAALAAVQP